MSWKGKYTTIHNPTSFLTLTSMMVFTDCRLQQAKCVMNQDKKTRFHSQTSYKKPILPILMDKGFSSMNGEGVMMYQHIMYNSPYLPNVCMLVSHTTELKTLWIQNRLEPSNQMQMVFL